MKFTDMQTAIARDKFAKAKGRKAPEDPILETGAAENPRAPATPGNPAGEQRRAGGPVYRPELESGTTSDLFAVVDVVDEYSLGKRLVQHGYDLYAGMQYPSYTERLRATILGNGIACVLCGPNLVGKLEDYGQAFARVTGEPLVAKAKSVARGTKPT